MAHRTTSIIGVVLMCLWRLAALSRVIVLHSLFPTTKVVPARAPQYSDHRRRSYDPNHPFCGEHYVSLGRIAVPPASLWSSLIRDSIHEVCARLAPSAFLLHRRRAVLPCPEHSDDDPPTPFHSSAALFQETPVTDRAAIMPLSVVAALDDETAPSARAWDEERPSWPFQDYPTAHDDIRTVQQVIRVKRPTKRKASTDVESADALRQRYIESLTQPLLTERVWNQLTGVEWGATKSSDEEEVEQDPRLQAQLLHALTKTGEAVARVDAPTEWIDWRVSGSDSQQSTLVDGAIQVWVGKCRAPPKNPTNEEEGDDRYMGIQLPFIKTRAILPFSISEVVDLLLDSSRVVLYNPWSLGRKDCWIDTSSSSEPTGCKMVTKIVQNRVQPPIPGSRPVVSTTLLHARPLSHNGHTTTNASSKKSSSESSNDDDNHTSWIIVSRSIGNKHIYLDSSDASASSRSDVLLGVNLLEPVRGADGTVDPNACLLTAVTHVYSPSLPLVLAERLGVQSAIKYIQDLRNVKKAAPVPAVAVAVRQLSMKAD